MYIKIAGRLTISKKMRLSGASVVEVTSNGIIWAGPNNRTTEIIEINGVNKYDQAASFFVSGPAYATSNSGVSPNGFSTSIILPVIFNSFYATSNNNYVVLTWSTSQELNNKNFEVQKSVDGTAFTTIAIIKGTGNSTLTQQYNFTDKNNTGAIAYYRIVR